MDMHFRLTLVYFMKSTKKAWDYYEKFKALILNQTGKTIKQDYLSAVQYACR